MTYPVLHPPLYVPTIVVPVTVQNGEVVTLSTYARDEWESQGTRPLYSSAKKVYNRKEASRSGEVQLGRIFARRHIERRVIARASGPRWMMEITSLENVLEISRRLSPADQLRLISLLSERLRLGMDAYSETVDMLSLAGLGAELWQGIDVEDYIDRERASWED